MIAYQNRAATVLFNLLACHHSTGPILLPANVCPLVPMTLYKANRRFEFVDISPTTLCMDHERVLERWSAATEPPSGLIYVRTYGAIFNADALFEEIKHITPTALVVDDRCACLPSFSTDSLGENVDAVLYSTGYAKYADVGYGGYAFVRDETQYKRTSLPFDKRSLMLQTLQYNSAISNQQKFLYADNDWLDFEEPLVDWAIYRSIVESQISKASEVKHKINKIYTSMLPQAIQLNSSFQLWRFNIHVADKNRLLTTIKDAGLFASNHYASLDGLFGVGSGINARYLHRHVINLFNDLYFDVSKAELISNVITNFTGLAPSNLE
jgi:hypothetical protein